MAVAFTLLPSFRASSSRLTRWGLNLPFRPPPLQSVVSTAVAAAASTLAVTSDFTWNDVVSLNTTHQQHDSNSDLRGFFDKVALCNRNSEKLCEFIPFVIEEQVLGYVHNEFAQHLRSFDVFTFPEDSSYGGNFGYYLALHAHKGIWKNDTSLLLVELVGCCSFLLLFPNHRFAQHLRSFDVFTFPEDSSYGGNFGYYLALHAHKGIWKNDTSLLLVELVEDSSYGGNFGYYLALHALLRTPEDRTRAVADVVKCLADELIPGIRNELYPVTSSFGTPEFFSLERAAAPYFGIKGYGVHMNGYVERVDQHYLWVGKRSKTKSKYPGKLDHLVAGGLPHGISCTENVVKECKEEAGIPSSISSKARAVGAVSYSDINGYRFNRDVLFCYDLKLPEDFVPINEDGEVESFRLLPVEHVANIIKGTQYFKANCNLVIMDFLFRHGHIKPEAPGYLKLLQSLRSGECT